MSSLLKLATDLEQKSKAQASDTENMLKRAFSAHEQSVSAALSLSAKRISDAISAHETGMNEAMRSNRLNVLRLTGRLWLSITLTTVLLTATCGSVLWYQSTLIRSNLAELQAQSAALEKLTARTWGVTYQEDRNGRFLVLPKGTSTELGWTVGDGKSKRNAVKLVKE